VYTDPLHLLAFGSDASFYRLLPKAVLKVTGEGEVVALLQAAQQHQVPLTFRAAGTSLSGQAITDSILVKVRQRCRTQTKAVAAHTMLITQQANTCQVHTT